MAVFRHGCWGVFVVAAVAAPILAFAQSEGAVDAAEKKLVGAEGLLARGQNDLAGREFDEFLREFANDARASRARFGRALAAYNSNDISLAATMLEGVATDKKFARREEALALLGNVYLGQGKADKALATLDILLKEFPTTSQSETAGVNRAQALYRLGRYAESQTAVLSLLKEHPDTTMRASAMYVAALDQRGLGDDAGAAASLKQLIGDFPNSPFVYEAQLQLGETLVGQRKYDEAVTHYTNLEKAAPESMKAGVLFGKGMALSQAGRYPEAQRVFEELATTYRTTAYGGAARLQQAVVYVRAGDRDKAREQLAIVAREVPAQANAAAYWLARCDLLEGKYDAAKASLEKLAVAKTAELPEVEFDLAYCDLMMGADENAIKKLEAFRTEYPHSSHLMEALFYEGTALHRLGDFAHSLQFSEAIPEKNALGRQALLLKAENLLMLGQYKKADTALVALEKQPASEQERLRVAMRRGQAAYFAGDYKAAATRLADVARNPAVEKDETLRESLFLLGDAQLQLGDNTAAITTLKSYLAGAKGRTDEASYKLAVAQLGSDDAAGGMETLRDVMKGDLQSAWVQRAWLEYGQRVYQQNDATETKRAVERVLSIKPAEPIAAPAMYLMARVEMDAKQFAEAEKRLAELAKSYPKHSLAEDAAFVRGICLKEAKKPAEAQQQFTAYLTAYPGGKHAADARHQAAVCQAAMGKTSDAIKTLNEMAARRETRNDGVLYDLAWAYRGAGDTKTAIATYQTVLKDYPQGARARAVRVELPELLFVEKRYQEAVDLLAAALADTATEPHLRAMAMFRLGHCYSRLGEWAKAAATFDVFAKTAANDPLVPDAISEAGSAYAQLDKLDEAKQRQNRVMTEFSSSPTAALAMLRLGEAQNQGAEYETAGTTLSRWLQQYTGHALAPRARFGLGWSLENRSKFAEAREAYQKVTAADNGITAARAQFQIGETYFAEKNYGEAAKELLKVDILYAAPEWAARALYEAGRAFEQTKEPERAKQQYRDCVKKYKDADVATMARKRLQELGG